MPLHSRLKAFTSRFGLEHPILLAPMAGACPPSLSIAVMKAGGMGACGAVLMSPSEVESWSSHVRAQVPEKPFQINLWIPDPKPARDTAREAQLRTFLSNFGPEVPANAGDATPPDFDAQCQSLLRIKPAMASSVMGLFPPAFVSELKKANIPWCAHITTLAEARAAIEAGADLLAAQGMEAGGHRGTPNPSAAEQTQVGLFSLLPTVAANTTLPIIAASGICTGETIAAALILGASAVYIGTGYLRTPEAQIPTAWANALAHTAPEDTILTRAFSGRPGRSLPTDYLKAAHASNAPTPAPYPVQRGLTAPMRKQAAQQNSLTGLQAWAGQSASLAKAQPAEQLTRDLWTQAQSLLPQ